MHPHMYRQLRPLIETGTTLTTAERFFVAIFGMGPHMVPDVAFERFTTDVTFVKPFVLVKGQNMPFQSVCSWIGLVAQVAGKFPRSNVQLHVSFQVTRRGELE